MTDTAASFKEQIERLDSIVESAKASDTTLEQSLDLLEEAVSVSLAAVELVDVAPASADELEQESSSTMVDNDEPA